jgi:hypothetical protein
MRPPTWMKTAISIIGRRMSAMRMYMRVLALFPVTAYLQKAKFVETGTEFDRHSTHTLSMRYS